MNRLRKPVLLLCDGLILVAATYTLGIFSIRYNIPDAVMAGTLSRHVLLLYACTLVFQLIFRTYDSLWRYAESREYLALLMAAVCGFAVYEIAIRILSIGPLSFLLLTAIAGVWVLGMLVIRFAYRALRVEKYLHKRPQGMPVAIVGAGVAGAALLEELRNNRDSHRKVVCFFDDDPGKLGRYIHGVAVKGRIRDIPVKVQKLGVRELIVAIPSASDRDRQDILRRLSGLDGVKVTILPRTLDLISQKTMRTQLRKIQIEDLLDRAPVRLDPTPVDSFLGGTTVLVTGGGGSIGAELCRQIVKHDPKKLVVVDIYENNAYDIQQELIYKYGGRLDLSVEIASVRDRERMRQIFDRYRPDVVFHAAAHKHVPLMEDSPMEAVRNNVFGTWNLVQAADEYGVKKFIQISTDKAVNPTNIMGASKRMCEMILQSMKGRSGTTFAAVRFGNVLGSNGSVVPLFKRQIEEGGPVTVTDKRIIRYFMTISEAVQLVLQAGAMARQNELYVLDMGRPVKILELAETMIRLSGYVPYQDIDIVETGLRPGEKLYEELLIASRDIEKTENGRIFVERQPAVTPKQLEKKLSILSAALEKNDPAAIRRALHRVVPTFHDPEVVNRAQGDEVHIPEQEAEELNKVVTFPRRA